MPISINNLNSVDLTKLNDAFTFPYSSLPDPTHLEQFQVLCLTDKHFASYSETKNAWLIDKLYQEGDIVLVESPENEQIVQSKHHQVKHVIKKLNLKGWDHSESCEKINAVSLQELEWKKSLNHQNCYENRWLDKINSLILEFQIERSSSIEQKLSRLSSMKKWTIFSKQRITYSDLKLIFIHLKLLKRKNQ